ncbi:hypothetical protein AAV98_07170 [Bacillus sp. CHD6a]|nr:hypothetical protein AAV98_07170 [Bacillus sp. CHD6a]
MHFPSELLHFPALLLPFKRNLLHLTQKPQTKSNQHTTKIKQPNIKSHAKTYNLLTTPNFKAPFAKHRKSPARV